MNARNLTAWLLGAWVVVLASGAAISAEDNGEVVVPAIDEVEIWAP